MEMSTKRRVQRIERKLALQQSEFEEIARENDARAAVGIVTRPCTECREGWVVKQRNRLICRVCGYAYYF